MKLHDWQNKIELFLIYLFLMYYKRVHESFYYLCGRIKGAVLTASGGGRLRFQLQLFFPDEESGHLAVIRDRDK